VLISPALNAGVGSFTDNGFIKNWPPPDNRRALICCHSLEFNMGEAIGVIRVSNLLYAGGVNITVKKGYVQKFF